MNEQGYNTITGAEIPGTAATVKVAQFTPHRPTRASACFAAPPFRIIWNWKYGHPHLLVRRGQWPVVTQDPLKRATAKSGSLHINPSRIAAVPRRISLNVHKQPASCSKRLYSGAVSNICQTAYLSTLASLSLGIRRCQRSVNHGRLALVCSVDESACILLNDVQRHHSGMPGFFMDTKTPAESFASFSGEESQSSPDSWVNTL